MSSFIHAGIQVKPFSIKVTPELTKLYRSLEWMLIVMLITMQDMLVDISVEVGWDITHNLLARHQVTLEWSVSILSRLRNSKHR